MLLPPAKPRTVGFAAALMVAVAMLTACASDSQSSAAPNLPPGYRWQPVKKVAATFAAPESWNAIDSAEARTVTAGSPEWEELAKRAGVQAEELDQFLRQVDVFLVAPPVDGFAPNIGVALLPTAQLPTDLAINQELAPLSIDPPEIERFKSGVGEAIKVSYASTGADSGPYSIRALYFAMDPGVLAVNVTTANEQTADQLAQVVSGTIHLN